MVQDIVWHKEQKWPCAIMQRISDQWDESVFGEESQVSILDDLQLNYSMKFFPYTEQEEYLDFKAVLQKQQ